MNQKLPNEVVGFLQKVSRIAPGIEVGLTAEALLEKYAPKIPEIVRFTHYVHDDPDEYQVPGIFAQAGIQIDDEDVEFWESKFGRPFYELTLECEFNTVTGKTAILSCT